MSNIEWNYKVLPKQRTFLDTDKKFCGYVGGIGSGKTHIGCIKALEWMINFPNTLGLITAPTYPMLRDATQRTFFEICPKEFIQEIKKGENSVTLINGSEVLFRSTDDAERLRGPNLDWFWMDEASISGHMSWKILIGRIRKGIIDKGFITGTPKGFNWVYNEFVDKQRDDYLLITSSSKENKFLPLDFIQSLEDSYVGVFAKQEIEGLFVGFEGQVYSEFSRQIHLKKIVYEVDKFKKVIAGVDWGWTNASVILVIGYDYDDRAYVLEEFYQTKTTVEELIEKAKELQERYNIERFYTDPSEPENIHKFKVNHLITQEAKNDIMPGIAAVSRRFKTESDGKPRIFFNTNCVNTITELEMYRYPESKEERPVQEKPLKLFDHCLDALRYALFTTEQSSYKILRMAKR